jgi:hypothetical protein
MPGKSPKALLDPRPPTLRQDDAGSFLVLEAILVALLVLTAILFFTSVQRPSTGGGEGGLDLGQVAADTLQILQQRTFSVGGQTQTFNGWITNSTAGDAATVTAVDAFLRQVLPAGSHYSLRLDNGVSTLQILPSGSTESPRNARAAEIDTLPLWAAFRNDTVAATMRTVIPGDVVDATDTLVAAGTYACYEAPNGYTTAPGAVQWSTRWQSAVQSSAPTTNGKDVAATLGTKQQIPRDLPLGKWKLSNQAASGSPPHCSSGTITYIDVVPPGDPNLTVTGDGTTTVTAAAGFYRFSNADVGLAVTGTGIPANTRVTAIVSASKVTLSNAIATGTYSDLRLPPDTTYMPYSVQLVVWFGA